MIRGALVLSVGLVLSACRGTTCDTRCSGDDEDESDEAGEGEDEHDEGDEDEASGDGTAGQGGVRDAAGGGTAVDAAMTPDAPVVVDAAPPDALRDAMVKSPDVAPAPVEPSLRNGRWAFERDGLVLEIDPQTGGRITTFARAGKNLLVGPAIHADNWGSTFWPAPQSLWTWPPPAEIDRSPYQKAVSDPATLVLAGSRNAALGLAVEKRFAMAPDGAVTLTYRMIRDGAAASFAPWEVTRVAAPGALVFFALGPAGVTKGDVPFDVRGGVAWWAFDAATITKAQKGFADGQGWMAYVDVPSRLLFVKSFPDVAATAFAPGEAEIELYVNGGKDYLELEHQGPYAPVNAAGTSFTVTWRLALVPADVSLAVGSAALLDRAVGLARTPAP